MNIFNKYQDFQVLKRLNMTANHWITMLNLLIIYIYVYT